MPERRSLREFLAFGSGSSGMGNGTGYGLSADRQNLVRLHNTLAAASAYE
jgi:hypothetical protein